MTDLFSTPARRLLGGCAASLVAAACMASPALAGNKSAAVPSANAVLAAASASNCTMPTLSEPFAPFGDTAEYVPAPGEAYDSFAGTGWTLSGGASIKTTTLQDGTTGSVLDLPTGAIAVSPPMCVQSNYPNARAMIRDITSSQAVELYAQYAGSTSANDAGRFSGSGNGWSASNPVKTNPGSQSGWQLVVFTLVRSDKVGEDQIYNFYVDPRMH
jgi:hypothetical protein